MANEKKFLDQAGVEYLWSKINMQDYPNNETLMAVITAIDETKADKRGTNPYELWSYSTNATQENYTPITSDNFTELITESLELNDVGTIGVLKSKNTIIEYNYITVQKEAGTNSTYISHWDSNNFSYSQRKWRYTGAESFDNLSFIIYPAVEKITLPEDIAYINSEDSENIEDIKIGWLNDKEGNKFAPKTLMSQVQTNDGTLLEDIIVKTTTQSLTDEQKTQVKENLDLYRTIQEPISIASWNYYTEFLCENYNKIKTSNALTQISEIGNYETNMQQCNTKVPMAGEDIIYYHGNGNLLNSIDLGQINSITETKYNNYPFVIYHIKYELTGIEETAGIIFDDTITNTRNIQVEMYDLTDTKDIIYTVPEEYISDNIARVSDMALTYETKIDAETKYEEKNSKLIIFDTVDNIQMYSVNINSNYSDFTMSNTNTEVLHDSVYKNIINSDNRSISTVTITMNGENVDSSYFSPIDDTTLVIGIPKVFGDILITIEFNSEFTEPV